MTTPYQAAATSLAWHARTGRLRLDVTGPDRAKCLNNLVTNDVRRLAVGSGCEAFVTSPQGKTLAFVTILALDDRIILRSELKARELLLPHLQKYAAFDDVAFEDRSESTSEIVISGPRSSEFLGVTRELAALSHEASEIAGKPVLLVHDDPTGRAGWTILASTADSEALVERLNGWGPRLDASTYNALRIEAGTPEFGSDVTSENLPQEIGRDARAINFVKGCYLGQETVARIDALGHVNRSLRGILIEGRVVPSAGDRLEKEGKAVGVITSASHSEGWGRPVALAMIRVASAAEGTVLELINDERRQSAVVHQLPMFADFPIPRPPAPPES